MSLIVYLALAAAALVALRQGPGRALLAVYLPVLLLVPHGFRAITPGLPDPNFSQAAILPIVAVALWRHVRTWRSTMVDGLVLAFAAWVGGSDYAARGYADAQNLMFAMLTSVIAPYVTARLVIPAERLDVAIGRRFVILVFAVAAIGLWEARFGYNPFHALLGPWFPGQGTGWVTTFRHGLARVAGPYSHAILAGIMMVVAFRLQRWLEWGGHWEPRFAHLPTLPWSKARIITAVLLVGTLLTVARGPWLGGIVAAAIAMVGRSANRRRALWVAGIALAAGSVAAALLLDSYLDIRPGMAMTMSQESAMYRKILFERYFDIAVDRAWFGWGATTWPRVLGMESIDNSYLLLALMHGVPAMAMLVGMLAIGTWQCTRRGLAEPAGTASPAFAFSGIFVAVFVALGTVYLGEQVLPTLFLVLGWSQGWLHAARAALPAASPSRVAATPRGFRAVIC